MTLIEEIELGETQTLEFKRIPNAERVKYQKTAVAFANGRGGRILFGVANDRSVVGIPQDALFTEMDAIGIPPVKMEVLNGEIRLNVSRKARQVLVETEKVHTGAEKLPIENEKAPIGHRESQIGNKKLPIERKKLPIDGQRLPFELIVADRKLSRPSREHLAALYKEVAAESYFDVQTASSILGMSERTVRNLLAGARSKGIIVSVSGHGKGKYRFAASVASA